MARPSNRLAPEPARPLRPARIALLTSLTASLLLLPPAASALPHASRPGAPGMLEPHTAGLLVDYYSAFLRDQDIERFRQKVLARYTEGTLGRLLQSGPPKARRAAVLALGLVGSMRSNPGVAGALRDPDPIVRNLAENALWAIWCRADTPENNAVLDQVRDLIRRGRPEEAEQLATRLIERSPEFAEAYNQRAIASFHQGRFAASAEDCRRTLDRNPYHIGALAGLGQCYLRLEMRAEALATFRRALGLQPHSEGLRGVVESLEAHGG